MEILTRRDKILLILKENGEKKKIIHQIMQCKEFCLKL